MTDAPADAPGTVRPGGDFSRVPYRVFHDPANHECEQQRLFHGPYWNYLGLEVEVARPGDYLTTYVGETAVVLTRTEKGSLAAFVNSCAHRGAQLVRRLRGNALSHTCAYHQWCYDTDGALVGVPQRKGVKGKGGMPEDFDTARFGLRMLRVETYKGIAFGTFSDATPPLHEYIGASMRAEIDRIFDRPVRVLGYYRQWVHANWKLYVENVKDPYHAGLLHMYHVTFGIYRPTMAGRVFMDETRGNSCAKTADINEQSREVLELYGGSAKYRPNYKLRDPSLFNVKPDYDDRVTNMILTIFPNLMLGQVANTFQTRHVRPKGVDGFELYWTYIGFDDDDELAQEGKLRQSNFIGPAGYISLEDGEAGRLVQIGTKRRAPGDASVLEMGGRDEIADADTLSTEVAIRGFWHRYHKAMALGPSRTASAREQRE